MNQPTNHGKSGERHVRTFAPTEVLLCAPKTSAARKLLEELLGAQRGPKEELKNTMKNAMDFLI